MVIVSSEDVTLSQYCLYLVYAMVGCDCWCVLLSIRCCNDVYVIVVVYIVHFCCSCVRLFIINWQCGVELMALYPCHVGFDGIVFIAPLYWGVNDVL